MSLLCGNCTHSDVPPVTAGLFAHLPKWRIWDKVFFQPPQGLPFTLDSPFPCPLLQPPTAPTATTFLPSPCPLFVCAQMVKAAEQGQGARRDESKRNDHDRTHSLNYRVALATIIIYKKKKKNWLWGWCHADVRSCRRRPLPVSAQGFDSEVENMQLDKWCHQRQRLEALEGNRVFKCLAMLNPEKSTHLRL